jgi:hypothetical protein
MTMVMMQRTVKSTIQSPVLLIYIVAERIYCCGHPNVQFLGFLETYLTDTATSSPKIDADFGKDFEHSIVT